MLLLFVIARSVVFLFDYSAAYVWSCVRSSAAVAIIRVVVRPFLPHASETALRWRDSLYPLPAAELVSDEVSASATT